MSTLEIIAEPNTRRTGTQPVPWLIDFYLNQQQQLTAVEEFSEWHEADGPSQAKYYSTLLPAAPPKEGEQYAFEVDLDSCSGCKSCVAACHSLNGLDETESWRDVGMLHGGNDEQPFVQHVTMACHHCLDPACLNGCPVRAYEKDAVTGIVKHLDDQCIGCQYCVFACPYDVPKYNRQKGIVRKCDMCSHRLAAGEAPACVQSCPNGAIRITTVRREDVRDNCETNSFLPASPDPQYTQPTTNYKTNRVFPKNALPADYFAVRAEHAHWPLIVMLVLTQLSVGAFLVELLLDSVLDSAALAHVRAVHAGSALSFGLMALGASVLHLGRPLYAFRAVIGLKTSWLSREILAFGVFAGLALTYAGTVAWHSLRGTDFPRWQTILGAGVVASGLCGVICSILIYASTRRPLWNGTGTALRFLLTTVVLGLATALFTSLAGSMILMSVTAQRVMLEYGQMLCVGLMVAAGAKLIVEAALFRHLTAKQNTPLKRSALLLTGELATPAKWRFGLGVMGGIVLPGMLWSLYTRGVVMPSPLVIAAITTGIFGCCLMGELIERYLFFTGVVAPRMPGGVPR